MRYHSEWRDCPSREHPEAAKASLRLRQTEERGEAFWDAEELDGGSVSGRGTGIACQPFFPRKAIMGAPRTGKDSHRVVWLGRRSLRKCDLNPLVAQQAHAGSAMLPATPITPEQGSRPNRERMQQQADPARLRRGAAMPLTLLSQGTRATLAEPSRVDQTQAAISLTALFGCTERLIGGAAQGPVRLKHKVSPRETACFPGRGESRRAIARGRGLLLFGLGGGSKLGGTHRRRLQLMPQFQAQVPHPLRDDLPRFLTARSVRTPAVGVLNSKPLRNIASLTIVFKPF